MSNTLHALDYLASKTPPVAAVTVLFGDESFLERQVRQRLKYGRTESDGDAMSYREFDGTQARWTDVIDELDTVSLFNTGEPRTVVVEQAEPFVREYRSRLEDYLAHPSKHGSLVISVSNWPANTKLYKQLDKSGLQVDCRLPKKSARSKEVDLKRIEKWIVQWGQQQHEVRLTPAAAERLLDLIGPELGMLDQELAKLALYAEPDSAVEPDLIDHAVGGWRCQTIWEAVDAVMDGDAPQGLFLLDRLLHAGEHPLALFAQLSWSLRRYGQAVQIFEQAERAGESMRLEQALIRAGFREWNKAELQKASQQIKRLGRDRARKLPRWLLEVDLALKGSHSNKDRSRFVLEQLFLRLATASPRPSVATVTDKR